MGLMRCFTASRISGLLALAALALQMAVSFGHVHLAAIHPTSPALGVSDSGRQVAPSHPRPQTDDDGDAYCAVCATMYLVANSFVPQAPQLPVPAVSHIIRHIDHDAVDFMVPRRAPFQPRAPPLA
jgi:hypothetical protein